MNAIYDDVRHDGLVQMQDVIRLNCKSLSVIVNTLSVKLINDLLRHWKENNTRLELFEFDMEWRNSVIFPLKEAVEGLNAKPWDPKRRRRFHPSAEIDCAEFMDFERDCDNLLASVGLYDKSLMFLVWNEPALN